MAHAHTFDTVELLLIDCTQATQTLKLVCSGTYKMLLCKVVPVSGVFCVLLQVWVSPSKQASKHWICNAHGTTLTLGMPKHNSKKKFDH